MSADGNLTAREMCEYGSRYLREVRGVEMTPEQIWKADDGGGLTLMYALYFAAYAHYHKQRMVIGGDGAITWVDAE